jgi:hypothetical protein
MAENIHSINLLPNKGGGLVDQFLSWALSIGRLLIILTETLALSVFLYRFSIDMRIVDLHDLIKNQRAIVEQFKTVEDTSRNLHARLAIAKEQEEDTSSATTVFSDIIEMGRGKITFRNLVVSESSVKIEAQSQSSSLLNSFISGLKTYPEVEKVSIDSVENRTSSAVIIMSITAQLKSAQSKTIGDMPILDTNIPVLDTGVTIP